jgi:hypothetical protein
MVEPRAAVSPAQSASPFDFRCLPVDEAGDRSAVGSAASGGMAFNGYARPVWQGEASAVDELPRLCEVDERLKKLPRKSSPGAYLIKL